jgi:hypothetical protein
MSGHDYLARILRGQELTETDRRIIRETRERIEGDLRSRLGGNPRFYFAGSYAKGTMLREAFDLDVVVYWPPTERSTLKSIFTATHGALLQAKYIVHPKTVALRLPYDGGFHVDVVPGRAQDSTFRYATLFKNASPESTLQTSLKVHIEAVSKTGLAQIVRILKIWRLRHNIPITTFALEILAARALHGKRCDDYSTAVWTVLGYIRDNIASISLIDPANTNNTIEIGLLDRISIHSHATTARGASNWGTIVW